jgi:hypothetical protein
MGKKIKNVKRGITMWKKRKIKNVGKIEEKRITSSSIGGRNRMEK